jgi:hypothetical protein
MHPLQRIVPVLRNFRYVLYGLLAIAVAAGFDFSTPRAQCAALRAADDTLRTSMDSLERAAQHRTQIELYYLYGLTHTSCQLLGRSRWPDSPLPCQDIVDNKRFPTDLPSVAKEWGR